MKLTLPQRTWIVDRSNAKGQMAPAGPNGFVRSSWSRTMENLRALGLAEPNAHGEYVLTKRGESYKEGALAAEIVWPSWKYMSKFDLGVKRAISETIGPNVHHPEETMQGAQDRWADLNARRANARCKRLPRHGGSRS